MTTTCPNCPATVLSPVDGRRPDPAAQFVMWALMEGSWQGADIDGGAAQDKAEALGLIAMTTYDPEKHAESDNAEPGDRWYVPSEMLLSALSSRDAATVLSTSQPEHISAPELRAALEGLVEAVRRDSDVRGKGISGYTSARLSDARAALAAAPAVERKWIIDLIHSEYDPKPSDYRPGDNWNDGAEEIADQILERLRNV